MKVLHLISGGETGGSKKHVLTLLEGLKEEVVLGLLEDGVFREEAEALGIQTVLFEQRSQTDMSVRSDMLSYISANQIQVLHSHGPRANFLIGTVKKRLPVPWLVTLHSDPSLDFLNGGIRGWMFTKLHLWALIKADGYFAVSERFKTILMENGIQADKIETVFNGIDFSRPLPEAWPRETFTDDPDTLLLTHVARLHPVKGHEDALLAMHQLKEKGIPVKLLLVGDGPHEAAIRSRVDALGLQDTVAMLGYRADAQALMRTADAVLLTSLSESFPLVLLEAAHVMTPVITTDTGGVRELIPSDSFGWITRVQDPGDLASAIIHAWERKGELQEKGERLHQHAKSRFDLSQLIAATKKSYVTKM